MTELHALFQHLLAHVCSSSGIVLLRRTDGTDTSIVHLHLKPTPAISRRQHPLDLERGGYRPNDIDTRTLVTNIVRGANGYDITAAFTNEVIGGRVSLQAQVSNTVVKTIPFFIRGKNPTDAIARAYITDNVDEEFQSYAWKIAKYETIVGLGRPVNGVITNAMCYNQFNPTGQYKELPNFGAPDGWGIGQIDRSGNEPSAMNFTTTREVYDWHASVDSMNVVLRDKRARYLEIIRLFRNKYQNDHSTNWVEPNVTTNLNGTVLTAREWSIITLYNGARGCDDLSDVGRPNESSPIHFDPTSSTWRLSTNVNNYAPSVISEAGVEESD